MEPPSKPVLVKLRRSETSVQWGFRMKGGIDVGAPLFIEKVNPRSVGGKAGLRVGDGILRINGTPTAGMSHSQAKMEITRSGNEIDFVVQRNAVAVQQPDTRSAAAAHADGVAEESSPYRGIPPNPSTVTGMQSRSFRMLEMSLDASAQEGAQAKPDSVFTGEQRT